MMNIVFMMISLMSVSMSSMAWYTEVFTTSAHPVALNGAHAFVCELDVLEHMTWDISKFGASNSAKSDDLKNQNARLMSFYQCREQARNYSLTSLPAIVVNKTFVIYGVTSLEKALLLVRRYREVPHE